jgi:hypothetical protein
MTATQIDHIVLLVPNPFFENPPAWLSSNFNITPGGYHNGQAFRNKLIIFANGTYLELFNWYDTPPSLDDENLPMRFWGPKQDGLIDFALTSTTVPAEEFIGTVNKMLAQEPDKDGGLGVKFQEPIAGSRKRADGMGVKWKVTRPVFQDGEKTPNHDLFPGGRIDTPFFCHDVTQRTFRVASDDKSKTTHPCGATGIAACEILVPQNRLAEYVTLYSKILGSKPEMTGNDASGKSFNFDVGVPQGAGRAKVVVREARSEKDLKRMQERGIGFSDLVIATTEKVADEKCSFGPQGIESTIWLENLASAEP